MGLVTPFFKKDLKFYEDSIGTIGNGPALKVTEIVGANKQTNFTAFILKDISPANVPIPFENPIRMAAYRGAISKWFTLKPKNIRIFEEAFTRNGKPTASNSQDQCEDRRSFAFRVRHNQHKQSFAAKS